MDTDIRVAKAWGGVRTGWKGNGGKEGHLLTYIHIYFLNIYKINYLKLNFNEIMMDITI